MNNRIVEPLVQFLSRAECGVWMCDFQFRRINYVSSEMACTIHAGISYNNTTFIIEVDDE